MAAATAARDQATALLEAAQRSAEHDARALAEARADLKQLRELARNDRPTPRRAWRTPGTRPTPRSPGSAPAARPAWPRSGEANAERLAVLAEARVDARSRAERTERLADDLAIELRAARAGLTDSSQGPQAFPPTAPPAQSAPADADEIQRFRVPRASRINPSRCNWRDDLTDAPQRTTHARTIFKVGVPVQGERR